jgi:hypothetical protein
VDGGRWIALMAPGPGQRKSGGCAHRKTGKRVAGRHALVGERGRRPVEVIEFRRNRLQPLENLRYRQVIKYQSTLYCFNLDF